MTTGARVSTLDRWARSPLRFPVLMVVYLGGAALIFNEVVLQRFPQVLRFLERFTADAVYTLMNLFFSGVTLNGRVVSLEGFAVSIVAECVGVLEMLIFGACVLAYPARWSARLWGLLMGAGLIFSFNLSRIGVLLWVGRHHYGLFDFFHLYFWQATLIAMITSVWILWLYVFVRR